MSYGVGVSNIFELLDDENDDGTKRVVKQQVVSKEAPVKSAAAPQQTGQKKTQQVNEQKGSQQNKPAQQQRTGGDKSGQQRPPRQQGEVVGDRRVNRTEGRPPRSENRPDNRGPRQNRPPRQRQEGQTEEGTSTGGFDQRGKRVYERRSGTGRGREGKKSGGGRGNWGADDNVAKSVEGVSANEGEQIATEANVDATPRPETEEEKKAREEEEKEAKLLTHDDYLKQLEEKRPKVAALQPRKIEQDNAEWASYTALSKRDDDESGDVKKEKKAKDASGTPQGSRKVRADEVLSFKPAQEERGQRGGRGGRGGKGGSQRGGRGGKGESAPSFDATSFPSLSTKA